jgi:hypothetical protein
MPKKITTIEELARMTQEEFLTTGQKLDATRKELDEHLLEAEQRILRAIEGLDFKIAHYASGWSRDFDRLHGWVEDLDKRVSTMESSRAKTKK